MRADWANVIVTTLLTGAGLWLAWNYGRQLRVSLASRRLDAYMGLWERTGYAAPVRLDQRVAGSDESPWSLVLSFSDRRRLYAELTAWYYADGNGILLSKKSRSIYLAAKNNLVCPDHDLEPKELQGYFAYRRGPNWTLTQAERGCLSIRQFSLLRAQMKADLASYGIPFISSIQAHELAFLLGLEINVLRRPWRYALRREAYLCVLRTMTTNSKRRRALRKKGKWYGCLNKLIDSMLNQRLVEDPWGVKICEQPATDEVVQRTRL